MIGGNLLNKLGPAKAKLLLPILVSTLGMLNKRLELVGYLYIGVGNVILLKQKLFKVEKQICKLSTHTF